MAADERSRHGVAQCEKRAGEGDSVVVCRRYFVVCTASLLLKRLGTSISSSMVLPAVESSHSRDDSGGPAQTGAGVPAPSSSADSPHPCHSVRASSCSGISTCYQVECAAVKWVAGPCAAAAIQSPLRRRRWPPRQPCNAGAARPARQPPAQPDQRQRAAAIEEAMKPPQQSMS